MNWILELSYEFERPYPRSAMMMLMLSSDLRSWNYRQRCQYLDPDFKENLERKRVFSYFLPKQLAQELHKQAVTEEQTSSDSKPYLLCVVDYYKNMKKEKKKLAWTFPCSRSCSLTKLTTSLLHQQKTFDHCHQLFLTKSYEEGVKQKKRRRGNLFM